MPAGAPVDDPSCHAPTPNRTSIGLTCHWPRIQLHRITRQRHSMENWIRARAQFVDSFGQIDGFSRRVLEVHLDRRGRTEDPPQADHRVACGTLGASVSYAGAQRRPFPFRAWTHRYSQSRLRFASVPFPAIARTRSIAPATPPEVPPAAPADRRQRLRLRGCQQLRQGAALEE